mmetsp:Transcript_9005/g.12388  ORF Transcript_9005/g.12388 Transcript_9005/m.12388 type:complete len:169 (+) Transcript_9005:62-568(+)
MNISKDVLIFGLKFACLSSISMFTGTALYLSVGGFKVIKESSKDVKQQVAGWVSMYQNTAGLQASLAAISPVLGTTLWQLGQPAYWAVSGITLSLVIPFTVGVMAPLANNRLFELNRALSQSSSSSAKSSAEDEASILLDLWDSLHWVRSVVSVTAFSYLASKLLRSS